MPTVSGQNLTLTTTNANTTIRVTYDANFTAFERHLAHLGLVFRERIRVIGVDPPGSTTGTGLANFPAETIPVTDGGTPQSIPRNRTLTVPRSSLEEDPGPDTDEIRCRIRIAAIGLPPLETPDAFTPERDLLG